MENPFRRHAERQTALNVALRIVDADSPFLTPEQQSTLRKDIRNAYIETTIIETTRIPLESAIKIASFFRRLR